MKRENVYLTVCASGFEIQFSTLKEQKDFNKLTNLYFEQSKSKFHDQTTSGITFLNDFIIHKVAKEMNYKIVYFPNSKFINL